MDQDSTHTVGESLELVFQMSNLLETGLDRQTLSVLIALCDLGLNPEALAAVVKEFCSSQRGSLQRFQSNWLPAAISIDRCGHCKHLAPECDECETIATLGIPIL
ncbi:hypothetical protein R6Q57_006363 [Mikania cordata]